MQTFRDSIDKSLQNENWFGALFLALALPDICSSLEDPARLAGDRYKEWFNKYLKELYDPTSMFTFMEARLPEVLASMGEVADLLKAQPVPLRFTAGDCYRARCKCLHQGYVEMEAGDTFIFTTPPPGGSMIHGNSLNGLYQLQIDTFCNDICEAVSRWEKDVTDAVDVQNRISELLTIHPYGELEGLGVELPPSC